MVWALFDYLPAAAGLAEGARCCWQLGRGTYVHALGPRNSIVVQRGCGA